MMDPKSFLRGAMNCERSLAGMPLVAAFLVFLFATPGHTAPTTVIVYGDSIAAGTGLPEEERANVWVNRVERLSAGRLQMINEGAGGRFTRALVAFESMIARHPRADILVLALGTNDSIDLSASMPSMAANNLKRMIELARGAYGESLRVLIVGPPQIVTDKLKSRWRAEGRNERLSKLNEAYASLARESRCDFVSLYGLLPASNLASDGMHPDSAGNEIIALRLLPLLLRKTQGR